MDLALALYDQAHGYGLDAAGGEASFYFFPEDGREFVAYQAVQHTTGLLGVDHGLVDASGVLECIQDGILGNLTKNNPPNLIIIQPQGLL